MRSPFFVSLTAVLGLGLALPGMAADQLYVQTPASFDKDSGINDKVKEECAIENKISYYVQESAKDGFTVVPAKSLAGAGNAKALSLTILNVHGVGGGAFSGAKSITVEGTLKEKGKVIGTFSARRSSGGGAFGGYKGTCAIFERCTKALGKDISTWLAAPSMNARLGEMK